MTIEEFVAIHKPTRLFIWREKAEYEDDDLETAGMVAESASFVEMKGRLFLVQENLDG